VKIIWARHQMERIVIPTTLPSTTGWNREDVGAAVSLWFETLSFPPEQRDIMKLLFPSPGGKHVSLVLPPHACISTCICL